MSTMPSEKLPTVADTFARSRSSKKETGHSPTSIKQVDIPYGTSDKYMVLKGFAENENNSIADIPPEIHSIKQ